MLAPNSAQAQPEKSFRLCAARSEFHNRDVLVGMNISNSFSHFILQQFPLIIFPNIEPF